MKKNLHGLIETYLFLMVLLCCYSTVLSGKIWQELEPEPKLWTKVVPEPKINNFGYATRISFNLLTYTGNCKLVLTLFCVFFQVSTIKYYTV